MSELFNPVVSHPPLPQIQGGIELLDLAAGPGGGRAWKDGGIGTMHRATPGAATPEHGAMASKARGRGTGGVAKLPRAANVAGWRIKSKRSEKTHSGSNAMDSTPWDSCGKQEPSRPQ